MEEALKEEEQQADRVYTAQLQCRRSSRAGREKRPVYIKHKISYPLSCPGMSCLRPITFSSPANVGFLVHQFAI